MPVVVAVHVSKPGRVQDVLDAFAAVSPLVHEEQGCDLYAAHTDGNTVILVERWSTQASLDAHSRGDAIVELHRLVDDALAAPADVYVLDEVPLGNPTKGKIQY